MHSRISCKWASRKGNAAIFIFDPIWGTRGQRLLLDVSLSRWSTQYPGFTVHYLKSLYTRRRNDNPFNQRCTKESVMKDEHMYVNPCINMVHWFQEEWELTYKIYKQALQDYIFMNYQKWGTLKNCEKICLHLQKIITACWITSPYKICFKILEDAAPSFQKRNGRLSSAKSAI